MVKVITDYSDSTDYTDFKADTDSADVSVQVKVKVAVSGAVQLLFPESPPLLMILKLFL